MTRKLQFLFTALLLMVGVTSAWGDDTKLTGSITYDTGVSKTNASTTYDSYTDLEIVWHETTDEIQMVELMTLKLPATPTGYYLKKAELKLVARRKKSNNKLSVFKYTGTVNEATYTSVSSDITTALSNKITDFDVVGEYGKDWVSDGCGESYRSVAAWTSTIDLTSYAKTFDSEGSFSIMISHPSKQGSSQQFKFFTKEQNAELSTVDGKTGFTAAAGKLVPVFEVTYAPCPVSVTIDGTTTYYKEITSALKGTLTKDATIKIYDDVEMSDRIQVAAGKTVNVIPQKAGITITNTKSANLSFLCNVNGRLNVGSDEYAMTITYSDASITNSVVESSNGSAIVDVKNVTFSGISTNKEYGLIMAKSGKVYLKNCTFSSCASTYGTNPCIIKCGNNDGVVFEGDNKFIDCTGYDIYAASRFKVNNNGVTNTTPINVYTTTTPAATNVTKEEIPLFKLMVEGKYLKWRTENQTGNRRDMQVAEDGSTSYDLTVSAAGAATLVLPYTTTIPSDAKCYTLSYTSGDDITAAEITGTLPAHTPVLVVADANTYTFTKTTAQDPSSNANLLMGLYTTLTIPQTTGDNTNYILQNQSGNVGFYKIGESGHSLNANRAYMSVKYVAAPGDPSSAPAFFNIGFGGITGISDIEMKQNVMEDENVPIYNLNGVLMNGENLPKGIYVKNGKKFVVK